MSKPVTIRLEARVGDVVLLKRPINGKRDRAVVVEIEARWSKHSELMEPLIIYRVILERQAPNLTCISKNVSKEDFDLLSGNVLDSIREISPDWIGVRL